MDSTGININHNYNQRQTKAKPTVEELNQLLKGKHFVDDGDTFQILQVMKSQEPDYLNEVVAELINVKDLKKDGTPKKNAVLLDQRINEILKMKPT